MSHIKPNNKIDKQPENRPFVGIGVMIQNKNGEVLIGLRKSKHAKGAWSFPGGHLEFGETIFETATRETREETGLVINKFALISVADQRRYIKTEGKHYLNIGVKGKYTGGKVKIMEPDKCAEWCWFALDKLPHPLHEGTELMIKNFLAGKIYNG